MKLVNFELAISVNGNNQRRICGTTGYMAPEMILKQYYGKSVDIWAFGVVLYILLCGSPPFYDEDQRRLFHMIVKEPVQFPEAMWQNVSPQAKDLIQQLLTKEPKARPTVEAALAHPWFKMKETEEYGKKKLELRGDFASKRSNLSKVML
jgi:serine/threonine protein kinase